MIEYLGERKLENRLRNSSTIRYANRPKDFRRYTRRKNAARLCALQVLTTMQSGEKTRDIVNVVVELFIKYSTEKQPLYGFAIRVVCGARYLARIYALCSRPKKLGAQGQRGAFDYSVPNIYSKKVTSLRSRFFTPAPKVPMPTLPAM